MTTSTEFLDLVVDAFSLNTSGALLLLPFAIIGVHALFSALFDRFL